MIVSIQYTIYSSRKSKVTQQVAGVYLCGGQFKDYVDLVESPPIHSIPLWPNQPRTFTSHSIQAQVTP